MKIDKEQREKENDEEMEIESERRTLITNLKTQRNHDNNKYSFCCLLVRQFGIKTFYWNYRHFFFLIEFDGNPLVLRKYHDFSNKLYIWSLSFFQKMRLFW